MYALLSALLRLAAVFDQYSYPHKNGPGLFNRDSLQIQLSIINVWVFLKDTFGISFIFKFKVIFIEKSQYLIINVFIFFNPLPNSINLNIILINDLVFEGLFALAK
jgi:hypothetical protein